MLKVCRVKCSATDNGHGVLVTMQMDNDHFSALMENT